MKNLAGNELEVRWAKCEDLVPGTWCVDIYTDRRIAWDSSLDLRIGPNQTLWVKSKRDYQNWHDNGTFRGSNELPIDDRYGPVLLGDKK